MQQESGNYPPFCLGTAATFSKQYKSYPRPISNALPSNTARLEQVFQVIMEWKPL